MKSACTRINTVFVIDCAGKLLMSNSNAQKTKVTRDSQIEWKSFFMVVLITLIVYSLNVAEQIDDKIIEIADYINSIAFKAAN